LLSGNKLKNVIPTKLNAGDKRKSVICSPLA